MYQIDDEVKLDVVDKRRYSNPINTIFYDIALMKSGRPHETICALLLMLIAFVYIANLDEPIGKYVGGVFGILAIAAPFLASFVSYKSKLIIKNGNFRYDFFGLALHKGSVDDLIEIHHLPLSFRGCYRIRVKGFSESSGFILHWSYVPEPLKHLPVIEFRED